MLLDAKGRSFTFLFHVQYQDSDSLQISVCISRISLHHSTTSLHTGRARQISQLTSYATTPRTTLSNQLSEQRAALRRRPASVVSRDSGDSPGNLEAENMTAGESLNVCARHAFGERTRSTHVMTVRPSPEQRQRPSQSKHNGLL